MGNHTSIEPQLRGCNKSQSGGMPCPLALACNHRGRHAPRTKLDACLQMLHANTECSTAWGNYRVETAAEDSAGLKRVPVQESLFAETFRAMIPL